jgi:hypothetical protein
MGTVQIVATLVSAFLQVGVKEWIFATVPDICSPDQESHLTCPHNQVFYTASAIWYSCFMSLVVVVDTFLCAGVLSDQVDNLVQGRYTIRRCTRSS